MSLPNPVLSSDSISVRFHLTPWSNKDPGASAPYKGEENLRVFQN